MTKSTSDSLHPTPLGSAVSTPQFSGPARHHFGLCSEPCLSACLSSGHFLPPSFFPYLLSQVQSVLDRHVLFPLLTINDLLFQPDQQICFSRLPCQSSSFSFLHSLSHFLVDIASPGPQSPHCFFPPPQLLCRISCHSSDCLSLSGHLLPSAFQSAFSHLLTPLRGGQRINVLRCPDLQYMQIAGFYSKDSNSGLLDRESIMPFRAPAFRAYFHAEHASAIK